jgi:hypothetical protein
LRDKGVTVITTGRTADRIAAARADGFEVIEADLSLPEGVDAVLAGLAGRGSPFWSTTPGRGPTMISAMARLISRPPTARSSSTFTPRST